MPLLKQVNPTFVSRYKPRVKGKGGATHTELSITIGVPGGYMNIPTIWGGKQLSFADAVDLALMSGIQFPTFKTKKAATTAAGRRSKAIGRAWNRLMQPAGLRGGP